MRLWSRRRSRTLRYHSRPSRARDQAAPHLKRTEQWYVSRFAPFAVLRVLVTPRKIRRESRKERYGSASILLGSWPRRAERAASSCRKPPILWLRISSAAFARITARIAGGACATRTRAACARRATCACCSACACHAVGHANALHAHKTSLADGVIASRGDTIPLETDRTAGAGELAEFAFISASARHAF